MPLPFHLIGALATLLAWLPTDWASTGMMLAGVALLIAVLLRRSLRYYGRRGSTRHACADYLTQTPRPASSRRSLSSAPDDVLRWQVEMHETARDLKAELDSKMRLLQLLVAQAREQADRLEALLQQLRAEATENPRAGREEDRTHSWPRFTLPPGGSETSVSEFPGRVVGVPSVPPSSPPEG